MRSGVWFCRSNQSLRFALAITLLTGGGGALVQAAQSEPSQNCASAVEKPDYPRLARLAGLSGPVTAQITVGASGRAEMIRIDGHPVFHKEVDDAVRATVFPVACAAQELSLAFDFRLQGEPSNEARTSVHFEAPNKYTVTSNLTGVICALQSEVRRLPNSRRSCSRLSLFSRRVVSDLGIVEFRVPRSAPVTKSTDVDYAKYLIRHGPSAEKLWLIMWFGPLVGGNEPRQLEDSSVTWSKSVWTCSGIEGGDWRGTAADGRRWRHINIPLSGYAAYEGATPKAAAYFDKILDSMCCGDCYACN